MDTTNSINQNKFGLATLKPTEQVKLLAQHLGISRSKLYELRKLAKEGSGASEDHTFRVYSSSSRIGQETPGRGKHLKRQGKSVQAATFQTL